MGYCVRMSDKKFFIDKDNFNPALNAMLQTYSSIKKGAASQIRHFEHLPAGIQLAELVQANWGFELKLDKNGNATSIDWLWEKQDGDEETFFNTLAPFVKADSFIEMRGEDGERWRFVFDGTKCKRVKAKIIWE